MRILLINTFHYPRGGASIYVLGLADLLRERGHEVFHFAMRHPLSLRCPETEEYWPSYINYPELLEKGVFRNSLKVLKRTLYSSEAKDGLAHLLDELGPVDIAHANNILHYLTPAVFEPLKAQNIPIIWSLHDYSLICPNTNFFDQRSNRLCSKCLKGGLRFIHAPIRRCKKSSFGASLVAALESWRHRIKGVPQIPDLYISPSEFLAERFFDAGFNREKFAIVPNFGPVPTEFPPKTRFPRGTRDSYVLFAGRLSPEKGVATLVEAWKRVPRNATLRVAGTGPIEDRLRKIASGAGNIEFLGFLDPADLARIRRNARFLVIPSEWWENAPLTILEAFSDAVPILGSNIGGIPEMVRPGETGELFEPGNVDDLAEKAKYLWDNPDYCVELGRKARRVAANEYSPDAHIGRIEKIYRELISGRSSET